MTVSCLSLLLYCQRYRALICAPSLRPTSNPVPRRQRSSVEPIFGALPASFCSSRSSLPPDVVLIISPIHVIFAQDSCPCCRHRVALAAYTCLLVIADCHDSGFLEERTSHLQRRTTEKCPTNTARHVISYLLPRKYLSRIDAHYLTRIWAETNPSITFAARDLRKIGQPHSDLENCRRSSFLSPASSLSQWRLVQLLVIESICSSTQQKKDALFSVHSDAGPWYLSSTYMSPRV